MRAVFVRPFLPEDLRAVKSVSMENTVYRLARSDSIRIVGIGIAIKGL